jgi:L-Ala-D/L-Glu epimerase
MKISRKRFLQASLGGAVAAAHVQTGASRRMNPKTRFDVSTQRLFLTHTWTIARNSSDFKDNVFVRIERDGIVGLGEAGPNVRYGENAELTTQRIEQMRSSFEAGNWLRYVDLKQEMDRAITDQACAKAALDIALLDWFGNKVGLPLYRLFGLDPNKTPVTTFSIGIDTPEVITEKVRQAADFPVLKIKVGREDDAEVIAAVRKATDKTLRVDANEGWKTREEAIRKVEWLQKEGVDLVEQPMPAHMIDETAWVRERAEVPIFADEAVMSARDIPQLAGAYDGINIKLMKAGGIQEAVRMIHTARSVNLKIMLGCMIESSVAISAGAHLSPMVDYADLDGNLLISNDPYRGATVRKGKLILPEGPGLGVSWRA